MKFGKTAVLIGLTVCSSLTWLGSATADPVEDFYKGKRLTLIVSASPGGGSDFFARQFAQFYGNHIPGNPEVIPVNKKGAGGLVAAAQLQKNEHEDGTVIALLQRNNLYRPLLEEAHDKFDPREVRWIGSLNKEKYLLAASKDSPVTAPEDMFTKTMILGATGFTNENRTVPAMMNKYLGTKFDIVHGYEGSEEAVIAMERGEVHGKFGAVNGFIAGNEAEMIKRGEIVVLMQAGWTNHPAFPDVPNFSTYVKDPEAKAVVDFFILPFESGRPLAAPKGVPADRLEALRKAFDETMTDPAFLEHMKKVNSEVDPISGEEVEAIIETLYATPENVLANVREILKAE
ncbi:Bug family tripartite tricarboxylate transporter substrate binding protein [Aliiruegeria lutimaris]|uniref:Tripartite-type tricarboxylate transporter, receptor component TctC n=1 Tax=Aliiruegeria lutimaris TaxID=571298 RepID=A0A1G9AEX4_9RHOB|nr:tripartite tricarboxylate transporter substrate-binding protein [Aliiruegeria lutimaris]SDK25917.1 Tripartite-type tricarboxylate transporter, receptor component TctC [Aliiruegeria lutimaris]